MKNTKQNGIPVKKRDNKKDKGKRSEKTDVDELLADASRPKHIADGLASGAGCIIAGAVGK